MASDYGLNFGFRRSDESVRVSEGRFRTPVGGSALLIGTAVQIDPAAPGFVKVCAAAAPIVPGVSGLLVQEEAHFGSIYNQDISTYDSSDLGIAKKNQLSVISTGAGTKVWYRNTTGATRADGQVTSTVTMATTTGVALGASMGGDGTKWIKVVDLDTAWMTVTAINATGGYFEGVLVK